MGPRIKQDKVPARALSKDEILQVLAAFSGKYAARNAALFTLMYRTGFRLSEALALRVDDVFQHGKVVDEVAVPKRHMKEKRSRKVPLHHEAKASLEAYLLNGGPQFGRLWEITRVQAWRIIDDAYKAAKIAAPHGTHACRKTFAQNCYNQLQGDIYSLSRLMGHSSTAITEKYLQVDPEKMRKAVLDVA